MPSSEPPQKQTPPLAAHDNEDPQLRLVETTSKRLWREGWVKWNKRGETTASFKLDSSPACHDCSCSCCCTKFVLNFYVLVLVFVAVVVVEVVLLQFMCIQRVVNVRVDVVTHI